MASNSAIAAHFEAQARACDDLGSPFTARLCRMLPDLAQGTAVGKRLMDWTGDLRADALALRLCGGLHRLVIDRADTDLAAAYPPNTVTGGALRVTVGDAIRRHDVFLAAHLDSPPQTNEVARSGMLLPGFLEVARRTGLPFSLTEIGGSAGLNLFFDRFLYRYGDTDWGDLGSLVRLQPGLRGKAPDLSGAIRIADRAGCDISPVDIHRADGRLRLKSYIWPDQDDRLARLDAAIEIARGGEFLFEREDAATFVAKRLAGRQHGQAFVLFHSIMWQYMPDETRASIADQMARAGASAGTATPLAWVRMEPLEPGAPFATLSVTLWPGGETVHLARCDYHGRWIDIDRS